MPVTPGYLGEDQRPERLQGRGRRDRLSGADQGGRRRRRQGHAAGRGARPISPTRSPPAGARRRRSFGDDRVLIEKYVLSPAPYRSAGVRRQARQRRPPVRARLLAAAPPPEGDRGSARAGHGRGDARGDLRARRCKAAKAVDYVGAGTIEFIADASRGPARRPHLVHGDEHPPAGRASGDRGDHRAGSGRVAAARRLAASRCRKRRTSSRSTAGRWRRGSMPRTRPRASCRRIGPLDHLRGCRTMCASTAASRRAARSRPSTTR